MTAGVGKLAMAMVRLLAAAPPDDPLGPVAQDPDAIRTAACKLAAPNRDCVTQTVDSSSSSPSGGFGFGDIARGVVWLLFIGLVVLLVVVAVRAVLQRSPRARRAKGRRTTSASDDDDDDGIVEIGRTVVDHRRSPAAWRAEADEHRRAGRHREALRCRYRALVGDLARREVIDEIPGRTTGEERRQFALVAPAGSATFESAADLFDGAWYGHVEVGDADVARMIALEDDVLRAVRTP